MPEKPVAVAVVVNTYQIAALSTWANTTPSYVWISSLIHTLSLKCIIAIFFIFLLFFFITDIKTVSKRPLRT
jgi:hypothetical protein